MNALTQGAHHVGLTVADLEQSAAFFTELLGWNEMARNENYPAIFVSDGSVMITLWALKEEPSVAFDRRSNIGLHHLAIRVADDSALDVIHQKLVANDIQVEFAPEPLNGGPVRHMMCYDPSGIRIEFIWPGA
ncbi:VOC family protein [Motiliproteus coralliicola]|uniref:VOC family protein n=1 Tax=Motiliproteus coralliicola TaxID=2283196 RepID=A0A369WSR3_9GAMM|nr:VOC family protein [Motiliproteus coralliicola]RDE24611.1 VOC family protein [Motiliproteus coralliicola]